MKEISGNKVRTPGKPYEKMDDIYPSRCSIDFLRRAKTQKGLQPESRKTAMSEIKKSLR